MESQPRAATTQEMTAETTHEMAPDMASDMAPDVVPSVAPDVVPSQKWFVYLIEYQVLLCLQCQTGIPPGTGVRDHLRDIHKCSGEELVQARSYASRLVVQHLYKVTLPPNGSRRISEMEILNGFRCMR